MNCREFFDAITGDKEYCKKLQNFPESDQLAWEGEKASVYSPEPVGGDEMLCRQVLDPTHFDRVTQTISPNFFDDASSKGASCHRLRLTELAAVKKIALHRVNEVNKNPPSTGPRLLIGFTTIAASEVRSILTVEDAPRRGAAVYDTGKVDDVSHADICQLVSSRQHGKSIRAQLFLLTKGRLQPFD